jgi:glycosyltransferase 2 family protein
MSEHLKAEPLAQAAASPGSAAPAEGGWASYQAIIKVGLSVTILVLLAYIIDWPEFARIALSARPDLLLLATVLMFIENLMVAARWKILLGPVGMPVTFMQTMRSYFKGHFVAYFVPASVTADVVKAVDLNMSRSEGSASKGVEVVSSIFVERGFGAITVGIAVFLGLSISPLVGQHAGLGQILLLAAAALIACCILALFADKFLGLVPRFLLDKMPRVDALVDRARDSFVAYRRNPGILMGVMLLSFAIQAMRVVPVFIIAVAIGAGAVFFPYLIAVPIIYMINTVPVIGSRIGTEQGMFVLLLGLAGVDAESALIVALVSLVLGVVVSLPGGYWLVKGRKSRSSK